MEDEIKEIKRILEKLKISSNTIESIELKWEAIFENKAFPKIKITFKA